MHLCYTSSYLFTLRKTVLPFTLNEILIPFDSFYKYPVLNQIKQIVKFSFTLHLLLNNYYYILLSF